MHQEFFDILHKDHQEVENILNMLEKASGNNRQSYLNRLKEEIVPHMRAEEASFYSALMNHKGSASNAQESMQEHSAAENTLTTLINMPVSSTSWMSTLNVLKDQIMHHIHEEEREIFDSARKFLSHDEMHNIMTKFNEIKDQTQKVAVS